MADKERGSPIGMFRANGRIYEHRIFISSDDRVECQDEDGNLVLKYTANCDVFDHKGDRVGRWHMHKGEWYFQSEKDDQKHFYKRDLLEAEMKVSQLYIEGKL